MNTEPIAELSVPFDPAPLAAKVERRRRQVRSRIISALITVAVLVAIYFWRRDQLQGAGFFAVYGLILGISAGWLVVVVLIYLRARKDLAGVGQGTAVRIGRPGVQVAELGAAWPDVASLRVVKAGFGRSPVLRLDLTTGRQAAVGMDQITVFPATLDSTARAFSGGRHGVDLSALEN